MPLTTIWINRGKQDININSNLRQTGVVTSTRNTEGGRRQ